MRIIVIEKLSNTGYITSGVLAIHSKPELLCTNYFGLCIFTRFAVFNVAYKNPVPSHS